MPVTSKQIIRRRSPSSLSEFDYLPIDERGTFMGFRRRDGRVGTRNYVLIVPTSMCASHEAMQISTIAEFTLYDREKYPNVGGVVAIPQNKVAEVEKYLLKREKAFDKPVAKIGIQEAGGTQAAIQRGLKEVEQMLPVVNETARESCPVSEIVLGVKCGGSDGFSGISANPALGRAADLLVRSGGTVLITEVPEFERMANDLDLSARGVIDGTETIDDVGQRVFERIVAVAGGQPAKAEEHKHREFQFWAEQTVSL